MCVPATHENRHSEPMTVFVVASFWNYEGYGEPEAAFATKADAEAFVAAMDKRHIDSVEIFELEVRRPIPTGGR